MRYLTKEWYLKCQIYPQTNALKEELDHAVSAYRAEQNRADLPTELLRKFLFHDGIISKIEIRTDCIIEVDSLYSECHRIIFRDAVVKQELPPVGATWLYAELYRHKSGVGYEVHILSFQMQKPSHKAVLETDLFDSKIICKDIVFA